MPKINNPHDKAFKNLLANASIAREFFQYHLPSEIKDLIDLNNISLRPNTYIDEALKETSSDVLYEVQIANEQGFLYVLFEHQSTVDKLMPLRILKYMISIWDEFVKQNGDAPLPIIIPLVFYHGREPYDGPKDIRELIKAPQFLLDEVLFKAFYLIDSHDISDEECRERHWAGVVTFLMKNIFAKDVMIFLKTFLDIFKNHQHEEKASNYFKVMLTYIVNAGKINNPELFIKTLERELAEPTRGESMIVAEALKQMGFKEGISQGISQGISKGIQKGESNLLLEQINEKFGFVSTKYEQKIQVANPKQLLIWGRRLLKVNTLQELFEDTDVYA